ncbi:MAG: DUF4350 domain-containing protein [Microbacterium sp.]
MSAGTAAPERVDEAATRPQGRRRRVWGWVALVLAFIVVGLVLTLVPSQQWQQKGALDPEHPGPAGGMAVAEILRDQGVDVEVVRSRDDALAAADGGSALAVSDTSYLSDDDLDELLRAGHRTILLDPHSRDVRLALGDGASITPTQTQPIEPSCALPEADRAGAIVPGTAWSGDGDAKNACYPAGDGAYGLLVADLDGAEVTLVDGSALFANDALTGHGNAALGLGLLGSERELAWYVPSASDADSDAGPASLGDLTPRWLTPAIVLLGVAAVAAGIWRGRRFGPLVAETLPVTVRGSETLEGRARLYERSRDAEHAAELVRDGAVRRMAVRLGLDRRASRPDVADAAATRIGARRSDVAQIIEELPSTDAGLATFGERLRDLEAAVDAAVRTERKTQ